jgi:hypothetical protein
LRLLRVELTATLRRWTTGNRRTPKRKPTQHYGRNRLRDSHAPLSGPPPEPHRAFSRAAR